MKITVASTAKIDRFEIDGAIVPARVWEGATESGVPVLAFITRISPQTLDPAPLAAFEKELHETPASVLKLDVEALSDRFLAEVREHYARDPELSGALTVLQALAITAAVVIEGTDAVGAATTFDLALLVHRAWVRRLAAAKDSAGSK